MLLMPGNSDSVILQLLSCKVLAISISTAADESRVDFELAFGNYFKATYSPSSFAASHTTAMPPFPSS